MKVHYILDKHAVFCMCGLSTHTITYSYWDGLYRTLAITNASTEVTCKSCLRSMAANVSKIMEHDASSRGPQ